MLYLQTFRTSSVQWDCASRYKHNESAPILEAYVAAFAGGPVGPGDQVGTSDPKLIMATW